MAHVAHGLGAHRYLSLEQFMGRTNTQSLSSHRPEFSPFLILNVLCDLGKTSQLSEPHSSYRGENTARHKVSISKYTLFDP